MKRAVLLFLVIIALFTAVAAALSGCVGSPVSGDKLFIPEGYEEQLAGMSLTEVAALPYFTQPFICVAKDKQGSQYAVLFRSSGKVDTVTLPISYEKIVHLIQAEGFDLTRDPNSLWNLHLFEIGDTLYWHFDDGTGKVYMDLEGKVTSNPFLTGNSNVTWTAE
jgi:hypothetical protein